MYLYYCKIFLKTLSILLFDSPYTMALVINSFKLNISNVFVSYKIYYKMMVAYFALIFGKDFHDSCLG